MDALSSRRDRLRLYRIAWLPVWGLLTYLVVSTGGIGWVEAGTLMALLTGLGHFISLSAWYSCKFRPIHRSTAATLIATHMVAALLLSLLWVGTGRIIAHLLAYLPQFQNLEMRFAPKMTMVYGAGCLLYLLSVAFHYVALAQDASREAEALALKSNVLAREAELKALKAQVNPHFLFNSLNSISALTSIDPAKAREMCIRLAEFLRMTLGMGEKSAIPLSEELALLEHFLAIEKVRFGERLILEESIQNESKPMLVLPLMLQPLVENAVIHGIANLPKGGWIRLVSQCHDGRLSLTVENTFDSEFAPAPRGGLGLANVRRRLEGRYGDAASMQVSAKGDCFRVQLTLPAESGGSPN
jgi:two-component system sensor histidine kinase AlgZ